MNSVSAADALKNERWQSRGFISKQNDMNVNRFDKRNHILYYPFEVNKKRKLVSAY